MQQKARYFALFLGLLLFGVFAFSASIINYNVPSNVPLNNKLAISGTFVDTSPGNILCSFFIYDNGDDQNQLIYRYTDEYTNSSGQFSSAEYQLTEPLFRRGKDYNAVTSCGGVTTEKTFYVDQKEDIAFGVTPQGLALDFAWFNNSQNLLILVFIAVMGFIAYVVFFPGGIFKR